MPDIVAHNLTFLLAGLRTTAELSIWSILFGTILGLIVGLIRFARVPVLNIGALLYIEFIRGTPLLVVLFITYFAFPALLAYRTTAYQAALVGFTLFIGAYLAEDFRAGLRSVRPSLIQAAFATGLTRLQVLRFIVLPQAITRAMPSVFNQYVRLVKFTSVASVIGVTELTGASLLVNAREFHPAETIATIAIVYLILCSALSLMGRMLYGRLATRI